jgi:hypothetical protein
METRTTKFAKVIIGVYLILTAILVIAEMFRNTTALFVFKPMLIPALMLLYYTTSQVRNRIYFISLLFAVCSNVFFLFTEQAFLVYGMLAFMVYRILSIVLVLKLIKKLPMLPFVIATLPFAFIFSCLLNLTMGALSTSLYPAIINAILISILAGISLSGYILDDSRANSWLAISTLLSVVLVCIFVIQKYYFANVVFQPLSAVIFSGAHYAYYKFMIAAEYKESDND